MSEPIYPADVETRLNLLAQQLEEETEQFATFAVERAEAEADYKLQYHTAILRSNETTVATKEAQAFKKSAQEFREYKIAEALEKATQQKLISIRTQIDATRTISANIRNLT